MGADLARLVDDKQQTSVSQYTYTKVYERSFMEVLYVSAACCNKYLIFKVCVCSLYLHYIFKNRRTDAPLTIYDPATILALGRYYSNTSPPTPRV